MIKTAYNIVLYVGVSLLIAAFVGQEAAAQSTCSQGVFVYLDVSGSMYSTKPNFFKDNRVVYQGETVSILDAMLKFIGSTFPRHDFLQEGDFFSLDVFATSVLSFRHVGEIDNYTEADAVRIGEIHTWLDLDGNGSVTRPELYRQLNLPAKFTDETELVLLLDEISNDLSRFFRRGGGQGRRTARVIVFTDADFDRPEQVPAFENRLAAFVQRYAGFLEEGRLVFLALPLQPTDITRAFRASEPEIAVQEFVLRNGGDQQLVPQVRARIQQSLRGQVEIDRDLDIIVNEMDNGQFRFDLPLRNTSCTQERMPADVRYEILSADGDEIPGWKRSQPLDEVKELDPYSRDQASVTLNLSDLENGAYRIRFEMTEEFDGGKSEGSAPFVMGKNPKNRLSPLIVMGLIVMVLAIIAMVVMVVIRRSSRKRGA